MPTVDMPPKQPGGAAQQFVDANSVVIVGANGSGKTRLGAYIEEKAGTKALRVGAQRALTIPSFIQPRVYEQAEYTFRFGYYEPTHNLKQHQAHMIPNRWGNEPYTNMLNDFDKLLVLLFAESAKRDHEYTHSARNSVPIERPPDCKLDTLSELWSQVMPQRSLAVLADKIETKLGGNSYEARHMSDGERVCLYLIGQALCAPQASVVIIDEPEIHLHRAIQGVLWDHVEAARSDCTFVYITHDLDFAATRIGARRVWLKEFDGRDWTWEEVPTGLGLPDALMMQILGCRRPILFVEGDDASHDATIYRLLYPGELVVPCNSCEKVIDATKTLTALPELHQFSVRGLVDRDRRGDEEIQALKKAGVAVADVAEVENLLCLPEVLEAVARHVGSTDCAASKSAAEASVFAELSKAIGQQAISRALAEIQFQLSGFGPRIRELDDAKLQVELEAHVKTIEVSATAARCKQLFADLMASNDYRGALRYFNCKGIVSFVAKSFGIGREPYVNIVISFLRDQPNGVVAVAMRRAIEA